MDAIRQAHAASYGTYGHRRIHAERPRKDHQVSHGRVQRLMSSAGLEGVHRRRLRACTRRDQAATPSADLVDRNFRPTAPDRLYVADITQHRTRQGWLLLAVVIDCFSRRVVGWSMADHMRTELVVDALQMAIWNRRPTRGHPPQRPRIDIHQLGIRAPAAAGRAARVDGQHRRLFDNSVAESFFATLQTELLDRSTGPPARARKRGLRLHRRLLQLPPSALDPGLPQPRRLRAPAQRWTPHRATA